MLFLFMRCNEFIFCCWLYRIYKSATNSSLQVPNEVVTYLFDHVHEWNYDIFHFEKLTSGQPLRYATYELCQKCELPKRHEVYGECLVF